jgi:hypothetical protein
LIFKCRAEVVCHYNSFSSTSTAWVLLIQFRVSLFCLLWVHNSLLIINLSCMILCESRYCSIFCFTNCFLIRISAPNQARCMAGMYYYTVLHFGRTLISFASDNQSIFHVTSYLAAFNTHVYLCQAICEGCVYTSLYSTNGCFRNVKEGKDEDLNFFMREHVLRKKIRLHCC